MIEYLKSVNKEISINDKGKLYKKYKLFDRTPHKSMAEADKAASLRSKTLDNTMGIFAILFIIAFDFGFVYLMRYLNIQIFSLN